MILSYIHGKFDSLRAAIQRGDLLTGDSEPRLVRLAKGAAGTFLRSDGTDLGYSPDVTYDGTDFAIASGKRFRMQSQNRIRYLNSMVKAVRTTAQSINSAVHTAVAFNATDEFDTDALHDTVTNNSRLTVAITGKYLISGFLLFDVSATPPVGDRGFFILKNAAGIYDAAKIITGTSSPEGYTLLPEASIATIAALSAGDHIEMFAYQNSGGALDIAGDVVPVNFSMAYVGE